MLTNSLNISDTTKREFFEPIFFQRNKKIWEKYCDEDLCSVSDPLTCWLSISVLIRNFSGIEITPPFVVYNFRENKLPRLILLFKVFQILCRFRKRRKNLRKPFWFWDNCIWIGCVKHWLLLRENTCHRESIC